MSKNWKNEVFVFIVEIDEEWDVNVKKYTENNTFNDMYELKTVYAENQEIHQSISYVQK